MRKAFLLLIVASCSSSEQRSPAYEEPAPTAAPTSSAKPKTDAGSTADAGPHAASAALQKCAESKGDIASIGDAVTRLNALIDKGGDGACFVATLPRPLAITATFNQASAQPAGGAGAPRIFFMLPKLVITAVPDGQGSHVLEFGQWMGTTSTIKAEIGLPVTTPLAADAPFTRILQGGDHTICLTCHGQEEKHPTIPNAFVSIAFKPTSPVALEDLVQLHTLCTTSGVVSARCEFIHAVFDFGEITEGAFSPVVATR